MIRPRHFWYLLTHVTVGALAGCPLSCLLAAPCFLSAPAIPAPLSPAQDRAALSLGGRTQDRPIAYGVLHVATRHGHRAAFDHVA